MPQPLRIQFTRRNNPDGTIDSICRQCCTTVAIESHESRLSHGEREHQCDLSLESVPSLRKTLRAS